MERLGDSDPMRDVDAIFEQYFLIYSQHPGIRHNISHRLSWFAIILCINYRP